MESDELRINDGGEELYLEVDEYYQYTPLRRIEIWCFTIWSSTDIGGK